MDRPTDPAPVPWSGADVLTRDGMIAHIRPFTAEDAPEIRRLHADISEQNLRFRFFTVNRTSANDYVRHLMTMSPRTLTLVATLDGGVVAVATAERTAADEMEVAFLVADGQHGRGLGSLLLAHLADSAREAGARTFVADLLSENTEMHRVLLDAGFELSGETAQGVTHLTIDLVARAQALNSADAREEEAERRSLRGLLHPGSVVVMGVRRDATGIGAAVLRSIREGGFSGRVDVVHPAGGLVAGVQAVTSCSALPRPADLAVIAVPAPRTQEALRDVADGGTRAAIVLSSGFRELGEEGARRQHELTRLARSRSVRLVGPNCLGLITTDGSSTLNATFSSAVPTLGTMAIASQSGGVGIVLLEAARSAGLGISTFVSLGNKADVSGNDLLAAWLHDPCVQGACLYLESFGNAHKFARLSRRFSLTKPLLAVVGGRSEGGKRAGASHTAAAASDAVAVDALMARTGVIRCDSAVDMASTALLLDQQPLPAGRRLGIVTNAGGMGVLAAGHAETRGLEVPSFSAELGARMAGALSTSAGWSNPIDTGAGSTPGQLAEAVRLVVTSGEVDCVLVVLVATTMTDVPDVLAALGNDCGNLPEEHCVPVALVVLGTTLVDRTRVSGLTVLSGHEEALGALARAAARQEWLSTPSGEPPAQDLARVQEARTLARRILREAPGTEAWLSYERVGELVALYGLRLSGETPRGAGPAVEAARRQGFPVVVKLSSADGRHKTEGGFVQVGVADEAETRSLVTSWARRLGGPIDVVVQPLASGVEMALGLVRDPVVGPLVMVAAGGVAIDIWDDRQFLLAPVTRVDAERALRRLKVWPLLAGHRGSEPVDVASLVDLVVGTGMLGEEVPEVAELDLNPVLVSATGSTLVDARARLAPAAAYRDAPSMGGGTAGLTR